MINYINISWVFILVLGTLGCNNTPEDRAAIASTTTPVKFSGFWPQAVLTDAHPNCRAEGTTFTTSRLHLVAAVPGTRNFRTTGYRAATRPPGSASGFRCGCYEWSSYEFSDDVTIPSWAWADEGARLHASMRVVNNLTSPLPSVAYAMTKAQGECMMDRICSQTNPQIIQNATAACGISTNWDIDVYVNK